MKDPRPQIYLDNAATTRALPEVLRAMEQVLMTDFGNPSSRHGAGLAAEEHLRQARTTVAERLGVAPEDLVFTSGGTEANALALLGSARGARGHDHLLVSAVEHPSVLESARLLEQEGIEVQHLPVNAGGWVDPGSVREMLRRSTSLVAVMHLNNETGVVQPVAEIASVIKAKNPGCRLLVDAVQSFTVLETRLEALGADLLTVSGHKVHGPKGVGCVALAPGINLRGLWGGGDQERGRRPGTENLPGIVGLGEAVRRAGKDLAILSAGRDRLEQAVRRRFSEAYVLGDPSGRAPHIACLAIPGYRSEVLVNLLEAQGLCVSSGSACHSRRSLRSHVLEAMAVPRQHGVIRFSLSRQNTADEVAQASEIIEKLKI